ncbi:MAG: peptidoglycan DD-metalloendopeptidase family protein [Actinobacteria bacterium]|nr:peptidoglycan DD-metalloendopeptidase family protein [Actinomycetota bacterium]
MPRHLLSFLAIVALLVSAASFAVAEETAEETLRDAREAQAEAQRARAELAKDIDVLEATDVELLAALTVLSEQILTQENLVGAARSDLEQARAEEDRLRSEIVTVGENAGQIKELTVERAIAAYIAPRDSNFSSGDPTADARRDALFRQVDLSSIELIDQLRAVEDDLALLERQADEAAIAASVRETTLQDALGILEQDKAAQVRIRAQLVDEIAALEAEYDEMAAVEAELAGIIRDKQREIARQEAVARAAARAATSTTTTTTSTAPTTTEAPDSGAADPDADGDSTNTGTTTTTAPEVVISAEDADLIWPTIGSVTSPFGTRVHPITGSSRFHAGIDIATSSGSAIWSAQDGTVLFSGRMRGYGEVVIIDHGGFVTLYAHMSLRQITEGARVGQGQQIGLVGSTGNSTGPHLHFEIRIDDNVNNPMIYLP